MTNHLHAIITPARQSPPSIYEELIDLIETAEAADRHGHPVEALVELTNAKLRLVSYLAGAAN